MLSVTIEAGALERFYDASRVGQHGSITLLHRDGTILFRTPDNEQLIGRSATQEKLWTVGLKEQSHGVIVLEKSLFNDSPNLAAYVTLDDYPLVIVVTETLEDALVQWRRLLHVVLSIGVLLTAVVLLLAHHLIRRIGELAVTRNELERLAQTDPLTGLFNRRHFWAHGTAEIARISRYVRPLSVLSLDLDHFKQVNDRYGHAAGDEALRWLAKVLLSSLRQSDLVARLGGEEFAVLLPETLLENAVHLAERIREALAATPVIAGDKTFFITASIGVSNTTDAKTTLDALLVRADAALYQAKEGGRNRTVAATSLTPSLINTDGGHPEGE
jgi:diguanylate cyclase (GGDEF)-like protein